MFKKIVIITLFILTCNVQLSAEPGDLISYTLLDYLTIEEIDSVFDQYPFNLFPFDPEYPATIYSVTYETLDPQNNTAVASGAIVIPHGVNYTLPLLSYQHGTVVQRNDVPSEYGFDGIYGLLGLWGASSGYITLLPDYLGLGVSEILHPYQLAEPSANSVIDLIRASKTFSEENNLQLNDQLFLMGYSEGGYATLAAQKMIEEEFPEEFEITASAPGAGAYDMSGIMVDLMLSEQEYGSPYYLPYMLFAYNDMYNLYDSPSEYLKDEYANVLPPLFDGEHTSSEIDAVMPSIPIHILKDGVTQEFTDDENHPLRVALRENDLYDWIPQSPLKLFHSPDDELVPFENSVLAYNTFIANGADTNNVELVECPCGGHSQAAILISFGAFYWIDGLIDDSTAVGISNPEILLPQKESLTSFPNPFNAATKIVFEIPSFSQVTVNVYDVLGRRVETIFNKSIEPGTYRINWDANELPSGTYFVHMSGESLSPFRQNSSFQKTRKLVLLK